MKYCKKIVYCNKYIHTYIYYIYQAKKWHCKMNWETASDNARMQWWWDFHNDLCANLKRLKVKSVHIEPGIRRRCYIQTHWGSCETTNKNLIWFKLDHTPPG